MAPGRPCSRGLWIPGCGERPHSLWPPRSPPWGGEGAGELELGSVPSELGRRKEPGPRGSCEDMEGSWGAGAGPEKPSGSLIPAPSLGQRSPIRGCSPAGISQLFMSAEAPRGACWGVYVCVHAHVCACVLSTMALGCVCVGDGGPTSPRILLR